MGFNFMLYHMEHGGKGQNMVESYIVYSTVEGPKGSIKTLEFYSVDSG